ncbi:MAG: Arabinose 5-phosphate isomerase KdsD [Chlamydiae bacterium]|nr:Arabinose 5-phosphate isomerase KdsD [Chlamydiota bacterium]
MLKKLFDTQQEEINYFFNHVDVETAEKLLRMLYECPGMIVFTGIGKSSFVAQKIATTMASVSIKSLFLSSVDALHGDIGILSQNDIFVFISRSGETEELLQLIPFLRNKGVKLVALVCEKDSSLGKACDFEMILPIQKELCPFGLMPTTSAAVQMMFGDILATELMIMNELKIEDYRMNHPAGRIGKRMTLQVKDLMLRGDRAPICRPQDNVMDILVELSNKQCGCMLIVDESKELKGIFTDGDLRRLLQSHGSNALSQSIEEGMTASPKWTTGEHLAFDAMKAMESDQKHPVTVLPVLEGKKVVGIIRMHDIIQSGV